jgi:hypothetical protein
MKKISAAFDGLKFEEATLKYAIEAADKSKAALSGVFLDDPLYHSYYLYVTSEPPSTMTGRIKRLNKNDRQSRDHAAAVFEETCKQAGLSYIIHRDKSFALEELIKESIYSDLLIINTTETFTEYNDRVPTHFISSLLSTTQCPVFVVPENYVPVERIILLFDGKPASVQAIKMFGYMMPWLTSLPAEVLTVIEPKEHRLPDETLMREFIQCHYPDATYTVLRGDAKEEIVKHLKASPLPALVVCGAYQRSTVSMWFKASMADTLMRELASPLFIAQHRL